MPNCKRCGQPHFNFLSCEKAADKRNFDRYAVGINRMSGHGWGQRKMESVEVRGGLVVKTSGLGPVRTGKLTYPKESL